MASSEAEEVWQMLKEARVAGGANNFAHQRDRASRASDMISAPFGATYTSEALEGIPVLRVEPETAVAEAPILWIHGGGFTLLSAHAYRHWAGHLAVELGRSVVVPDYSLAPEHPFPAALDEVLSVYHALVAAHPGESPAIVGVSAGGALAVGAQLRLLRDGGAQPALTLIVCPWLDLTLTNRAISDNADYDVHQDVSVLRCDAAAYLDGIAPTHPIASPAHADVAGLGPLFILAAEYDLLLDDSVHFARRCAAAGVDVALEIVAGMPHGFPYFVAATPEARAALSRIADTIRCRLG